jgi:uncharacterized integral membrane protein
MTDGGEPKAPAPDRAGGTGISTSLIVGVLLTVAVIILAAQNTTDFRLRLLWWDTHSPLVVIILGSALAGVVLDEVVGLLWRLRRRRHLRQREGSRGRRRGTSDTQ